MLKSSYLRGERARGQKSWRKQHLAELCLGWPAVLMDLRWRNNLLIEVTFACNSMSSVYFKHFFSFQICALDVFLFRWFVVKWDFQGLDHIWPELVPISAGECNPNLLLSCLIIRWSDCVAALCHIPTLSAPHFSQYIYSPCNMFFSLKKSLLPLPLSFTQLCLTRIFGAPYFMDWQDWTECWALREITRRKVEQQQCTDYSRICVRSTWYPLSSFYQIGCDGGAWDCVAPDKSKFGFIRTKPDQDRKGWSLFNRISPHCQIRWRSCKVHLNM